MKKFLTFWFMAILMVIPMSLTSCGDDDDKDEPGTETPVTNVTAENLTGTWRCTSSYYEDPDGKEVNEDVGTLIYLNADGSMKSTDAEGYSETGTWSVKKGILTIIYNDEGEASYPVNYTITECSANKLTFTAKDKYSYIKVSFVRVK